MPDRNVSTSFWDHPKIRRVSAEAKLIALCLLTNRRSHISGLFYMPIRDLAHDAGLPEDRTRAALEELQVPPMDGRDPFCLYDEEHETVWVCGMMDMGSRSPKIVRAVEKHLLEIHSRELIAAFLRRYDTLSIEYPYPIDTVSIPYRRFRENAGYPPSPIPTPIPDPQAPEVYPKAQGNVAARQKRAATPPSDAALEVSRYLLEAIRSWNPEFAPQGGDEAAVKRWARDIDLALRNDPGRTPERLRAAIDYAHRGAGADFWRPNILSGKKLREKYDTMSAQARAKRDARQAPRLFDDNAVDIAEVRRRMEIREP